MHASKNAIVSLNIRCGSPSLPVALQCDDNQIRMCWFKFNVYSTPKVTLHCYYIYLCWLLVSGILNQFTHIKVKSMIYMAVECHDFAVINATTMFY